MRTRFFHCLLLIITLLCNIPALSAKKIHNRTYRFSMNIPDQMICITDKSIAGDVYYDTSAGIIMMIAAREGKFKSVKDYIDCSKDGLEEQLRAAGGDPALQLINCCRSIYYPKKSTMLYFHVVIPPSNFDTHLIYFIHHRHSDVQIWFSYRRETEANSAAYINAIMQTMRLR